MIFNPNGTLKGEGDIIEKIILKKKQFDFVGTLRVGFHSYIPKFHALSLHEELCSRIKECRKNPDYFCGNKNEKALLDEGILAIGPDGNIQHGPNGFDFSQIKTYDELYKIILLLTKIRNLVL